MHVGENPNDAARFLLGVLPTGPLLDALDPAASAAVVDAVAMAFEERGNVDLEGASWIVTARNN